MLYLFLLYCPEKVSYEPIIFATQKQLIIQHEHHF